MDKKLLMQKAYNWIAEQDENAAIISDGDIDIASEFIAEFIQNLIDNGVLAEPSNENAVLPIHGVSNLVCDCIGCTEVHQINGKFICGTCNRPLAQTCC